MALLKKKTRKAIRKAFKKTINKHGPTVVQHLATGIAAGLATYIGAEGKKAPKQLKKVAKTIPGGKKIIKAVESGVPLLTGKSTSSKNGDSHNKEGARARRSKKSHAA